jgi:CSLREA domain-containing protein
VPRHPLPFLSGAAILLAATVASAATLRVNDTSDAVDAAPGDGVCATAGGACTLRAAVQEANALAGTDRIRVPAGTYVLTQAGFYPDDDASTGDLDLAGHVGVVGEGSGATIVDGNGIDRVFHVLSGARVRLAKLAVRGGVEPTNGSGGGILSWGARLTLKRLLIEDNEALIGGGLAGGLGPVRLVASTVRGARWRTRSSSERTSSSRTSP